MDEETVEVITVLAEAVRKNPRLGRAMLEAVDRGRILRAPLKRNAACGSAKAPTRPDHITEGGGDSCEYFVSTHR